jgi:hypothetical protein
VCGAAVIACFKNVTDWLVTRAERWGCGINHERKKERKKGRKKERKKEK